MSGLLSTTSKIKNLIMILPAELKDLRVFIIRKDLTNIKNVEIIHSNIIGDEND